MCLESIYTKYQLIGFRLSSQVFLLFTIFQAPGKHESIVHKYALCAPFEHSKIIEYPIQTHIEKHLIAITVYVQQFQNKRILLILSECLFLLSGTE